MTTKDLTRCGICNVECDKNITDTCMTCDHCGVTTCNKCAYDRYFKGDNYCYKCKKEEIIMLTIDQCRFVLDAIAHAISTTLSQSSIDDVKLYFERTLYTLLDTNLL